MAESPKTTVPTSQPLQKRKGLLQRIFDTKTEPVQEKAHFKVSDLKGQKYVSGNPKISRYYYEYMSLSRDFVAKFKDFESMLSDPTIQNALTFICDDVTSYSPITKKRIWSACDDADTDKILEDFVNTFELNKRIWDDTYKLCLYGNLIFRLRYKNKEDYSGGIESIEAESNIFRYVPIEINNVLVGWIDSIYDCILEPFEVIHFKIGSFRTEKVVDDKYYTIKAKFNTDDKRGDEELKSNFVLGSSLFENIRRIWRQIKLIEDNLILTRLDRSALIRIYKVAVGNLDADDKAELLDYYTELLSIEKDLSISDDVLRQNKAQVGHGSNIVIPVGETGDLTVEEFGGNADVMAMADVDKFEKKFFASLVIPPEFLGLGQETTGLNIGEGDLKRKEIRYAKTVKKIQFSEIEGYKTIAYYHLLSLGVEIDFDKFDMVMGVVSTAEEEEFKNSLKTSAETIATFFEFITGVKDIIGDPSINVPYLLNYLTGRVMGMSDLSWDELFNDFQVPSTTAEAGAEAGAPGEPQQGEPQPQESAAPVEGEPTPPMGGATEAPTGGGSVEKAKLKLTTIEGGNVDVQVNPEIGAPKVGGSGEQARLKVTTIQGGSVSIVSKLMGMESKKRKHLLVYVEDFVRKYQARKPLILQEKVSYSGSLKYITESFHHKHANEKLRYYLEDQTPVKKTKLTPADLRETVIDTEYFDLENFDGFDYQPGIEIDLASLPVGKDKTVKVSDLTFMDSHYDSFDIQNVRFQDIFVYEVGGRYYIDKSNAVKLFNKIYKSDVAPKTFKATVFKIK